MSQPFIPLQQSLFRLPEQVLLFVALAFTGRTGLVGGALGVVGQLIVGAAPFGTYLADTIDDFFALAGWTGGAFFFTHIFLLLLVHQCDGKTSKGCSRFFFSEVSFQFFQQRVGEFAVIHERLRLFAGYLLFYLKGQRS